ncbi:MAG: transporter [Deltaproteobacteria bacterium]|nr:transporter [Deltaproteobacteria bacterium]
MKIFLTLLLNVLFFSSLCLADNSLTLPAGRFRARIKPIYSPKITTQYNNETLEESLVSKFAVGVDIPTAQALSKELAYLMQTSNPPVNYLGQFKPDLQVSTLILGTALEYGVTEKLTAGLIVPVAMAATKFKLDFEKSQEALSSPNPQIRYIDVVHKVEAIAQSKGYTEFSDWAGIGLGDAELGVKYHALNTAQWSFAIKSGLRIPTGRVDDPDNLTDIGFGDGQWDVGTTFLLDYKPLSDLLLNLEARFTIQLPDKEKLRVPGIGELFTDKKDELSRNLGDHIQAALTAQYNLFKLFNLNLSYNFLTKGLDSFQSDKAGMNVSGLGLKTSQLKHSINFGTGFSTLPWFLDGKFKLPMDVGLNLELPFLGKNVLKATSFNLEYKFYF